MLKERPGEAQQPSERITKANHLRFLASGYKALKKDKAKAYQAAAEALDLVEERSKKDKPQAPVRDPQLVSE